MTVLARDMSASGANDGRRTWLEVGNANAFLPCLGDTDSLEEVYPTRGDERCEASRPSVQVLLGDPFVPESNDKDCGNRDGCLIWVDSAALPRTAFTRAISGSDATDGRRTWLEAGNANAFLPCLGDTEELPTETREESESASLATPCSARGDPCLEESIDVLPLILGDAFALSRL